LGHGLMSPGAHAPPPLHVLHALHAPQLHVVGSQVRVRVWVPSMQFPHARVSVCVSPGVHRPLPPPTQVPHGLHSLQLQSARQVRVRICVPVPQAPQLCMSVCVVPAAQTPSPSQAQGPQLQSMPQVRRSTPQLPQAPPVPMSPGEHGPEPVHGPSFCQRPATQICRCTPQRSQGIIRAGAPGSQVQSVGAEHPSQTPSSQRCTPLPQGPSHDRSAIAPTVGSWSSQSIRASIPSRSSSEGGTQVPATHLSGARQGGSQTPDQASRSLVASRAPPASRGPASGSRGRTGFPVAQAPVIHAMVMANQALANMV